VYRLRNICSSKTSCAMGSEYKIRGYIIKSLEKNEPETENLLQIESGDDNLSVSEEITNSTIEDVIIDEVESISKLFNHETKVDIIDAKRVGVVGTGNFGKAITTKLMKCGIKVVVGSRNPAGPVVSIEKSFEEKIVILAVPSFSWPELPLTKISAGTVLIDCSNRNKSCAAGQLSQAEELQQLLPPGVHVVKGFNTISAYELENQTFSAGQQVPIAGNDQNGKQSVGELLDKLGYHVSDMGGLEQSRLIENIPLALFLEWKKPFFISVLLWFFFYFLTFGRYHLVSDNELGWHSKGLERVFTKYINKTCDCHALVLLAACYLPGIFAAYLQLARGTKYSEFPAWLDNWLKMRKQFGIFMLLSASIHACFYVLLLKPHYGKISIPTPSKDDWDWDNLLSVQGPERSYDLRMNIVYGAGIIAYFIAVILGVTSLPSVSAALTWKEFRLIQSWLGWLCLILASTHCGVLGWSKLFRFRYSFFLSSTQLPLILPAITIILKIPLLIPFVDTRLTMIRQGKVF